MEPHTQHLRSNPVAKANFFSRLYFCWLNSFMWKGYKNKLEEDDMFNLLDEDTTQQLSDQLNIEWQKELTCTKVGHEPNLMKALRRTYGFRFALGGILVLIEGTTKVCQPLLLAGLIRYFDDDDGSTSKLNAYMYALGMTLCSALIATVHHPYFYSMKKLGMRIRIACSALIYEKSLTLGHKAFQTTTTGQIVNLLTNDVNRFDLVMVFLHYLWAGTLHAIAVFIILWLLYGPVSLLGMTVLLLLIPMQAAMGKLFTKFRIAIAKMTDERVKVMNEILSGIRVIKMYCWENLFTKLNEKARRNEMAQVVKSAYVKASVQAPFFNSTQLIVFSLVLCYLLTSPSEGLSTETIFMTMALIEPLRVVCTLFIPFAVQFGTEAKVSVSRIQEFLLLEEVSEEAIGSSDQSRINQDETSVKMFGVSAAWQKGQSSTIFDISFGVQQGELLIIIGPVGAGKTSLLLSLLSELPLTEGSIQMTGRVAYSAQEPWLFSASVKQNILFGCPYDSALYDKVVHAVCLKQDFAELPDGDQTIVGERGVTLSGGQKARIGLARTLYIEADIYLLDDPLSAVDAAVSKHLFDKCLCGLLKDRIRILVTHQLQYLPRADKILILKEGAVSNFGTYESLLKQGVDFNSFLSKNGSTEEMSVKATNKHLVLHQSMSALDEPIKIELSKSLKNIYQRQDEEPLLDRLRFRKKITNAKSLGNLMEVSSRSLHHLASVESLLVTSFQSLNSAESEPEDPPSEPQKRPEEARRGGSVGHRVYLQYFWAGSGCIGSFLLIFFNLLAQVTYVITDWFLSYWTQVHKQETLSTSVSSFTNISSSTTPAESVSGSLELIAHQSHTTEVDTSHYIYIYTGLVLSVLLFGFIRSILVFRLTVRSSEKLHSAMSKAVVRSPILFFDTNPIGRILNRFSKDVGLMDEQLPFTMYSFIQGGLMMLGVIVVVGVINPFVFIPILPLIALFLLLRRIFIAAARNVKRIEATSRSPLFSHLSTSLDGIHTIRSLRAQDALIKQFHMHQDAHTEAWDMFLGISQWFAVRLDWLCVTFIGCTAFLAVIVSANLNAGLVGLTLVYAIGLMGFFQWVVRQSAEVENQMVSVERVLEYSKLPAEDELFKDVTLSEGWPKDGEITAHNVNYRYSANSPAVLRDINFNIQPGERIGVVGRTGAGKSSLIAMLFRLAEPEGAVSIDGVNTRTLGLHQLRGCMSIIPQDPVLFSGSIRRNLDPFSKSSDHDIWKSLKEVEMQSAIQDLPAALDSPVSEGGSNFSVGQRQLLCLCRALLRNHKILLIDEATANVDPLTDSLIQSTLRRTFVNCTVITIAHRINTVVDSDRIIVLSKGRIREFDAPYKLLQNTQSTFSAFLRETGKVESDRLYAMAKNSYFRKKEQRGRKQNNPNDVVSGIYDNMASPEKHSLA